MDKNNFSARLNRVIPGGAHTYSRGDDQFPENAPPVLTKGAGAYVWGPERKYLDYGMALRAVTLGYSNEEVNEAAIKQIHLGNNLTRASEIELEAAELLVDLIPAAEMVKFAKSGSSATSAAVKLARAFTGRPLIARCLQHPFFSYDDWFIGDTVVKRGVPNEVSSLTVNFNFNDIESLKALFAKYEGQIAGVILEPATAEEPKKGFLEDVRALCSETGAVFILDEMITGFRWDLRGAQTYYGITPDLTTFGKGMANGFSVAAVAGKREIMELGGIKNEGQERVFLMSSTHGAEMCGLGAFVKTVSIYKRDSVTDRLWRYGKELISRLNDVSRGLGIEDNFYLEGPGCSPVYVAKDAAGQVSLPFRTLFAQEMVANGVLMPWIALSASHGAAEMELTVKAAENALGVYKKALEGGIETYLRGPAIKPVFRKHN